MEDHFYFNRAGEPIDLETWAKGYEDYDSRVLARTQVGPVMVITVWIGTPDFPGEEDPPLIFGSIIKTGEAYSDERRTATELEAMRAHNDLVALAEKRVNG